MNNKEMSRIDYGYERIEKQITPEEERQMALEVEKSKKEYQAKVAAEQAFWAKVPDAGIDAETGEKAKYCLDAQRTPEGQILHIQYKGDFYSLGGHIKVDGKSLTKLVPYTTAEKINLADAVMGAFSIDPQKQHGGRYIKAFSNNDFNKFLGRSLKFIKGIIGVREYHPSGRGDVVYVLDDNSKTKVDVNGRVFDWISSGNDDLVGDFHRYKDVQSGIHLIFSTNTYYPELSGTIIKPEQTAFIE